MLIKVHTEIEIENKAEEIFEYAADPANWTASNPEEHFGLEFFNARNRPETGVEFYQKEMVAGVYNDLRGHIVVCEPPRLIVWRGLAKYRLLGSVASIFIPEGGVIRIEESKGKSVMSHDYYIDFPETALGRLMKWYFGKKSGKKNLFDHGNRELEFFKKQLDRE